MLSHELSNRTVSLIPFAVVISVSSIRPLLHNFDAMIYQFGTMMFVEIMGKKISPSDDSVHVSNKACPMDAHFL